MFNLKSKVVVIVVLAQVGDHLLTIMKILVDHSLDLVTKELKIIY